MMTDWQTERKEKRAKFDALAAEILTHLVTLTGKPWEREPADRDDYGEHGTFKLDDLTLSIHQPWPDKLEISGGNYPRLDGHCYYPRGGWPKIGVSVARGPEAIAKDIKRRLLPTYETTYAEGLANFQKDSQYKNEKMTVLREFAAIIGDKDFDSDRSGYRRDNGVTSAYYHVGDGTEHVEVHDYYHGKVGIKISGIPVDVAKQIATLVAQAAQKEESTPEQLAEAEIAQGVE